jgi:uncharacterized membrane protein
MKETVLRSVVKAYSYRLCGTVTTVIISYVMTGQLMISIAIGATEFVVKPALYWVHERMWTKIWWGYK